MLDWLNLGSKNYPEFWMNYLSSFEVKIDRTVMLTIHTTGNDYENDLIISIAAIAIKDNAIVVGDSYEAIIAHRKLIKNDDPYNQYLDVSIKDKVTEQTAIESFVNYLKNSKIIGHRIDLEIEFLNAALSKIGAGKLKNEALDVEIMFRKWKDISDSKDFTINDLRNEFKIEKSAKNGAIEDTFDLALVFLKLKIHLGL